MVKLKKVFSIIVLAFLLVCMNGCTFNQKSAVLEVVLNDIACNDAHSFFKDYSVHGDTVDFYCSLTIKNNSQQKKTFMIEADFEVDYNNGFITEKTLSGYDKSTKLKVFAIEPNTTTVFEDVCFSVTKGLSCDKKNDRLLPKINIKEVTVRDDLNVCTGITY